MRAVPTVNLPAGKAVDLKPGGYHIMLMGLKRELEILKMTNAAKIELDKVKAQLAETRMELAVQRELAQMTAKAQQVADTDMEPVGRAEPGKAFQQ